MANFELGRIGNSEDTPKKLSFAEGCFAGIIAVIFIVVLITIAALSHAFVLTTIWGWIAVVHFGLPVVSFWAMFCVAEFVGLITAKPPRSTCKDEDNKAFIINLLGYVFVLPWFVLGIVYLVKTFAL